MAPAAPSLGHRLDSATVKLNRAYQHLARFHRLFRAVSQRQAFDVSIGTEFLFQSVHRHITVRETLSPSGLVLPQTTHQRDVIGAIDLSVYLTPNRRKAPRTLIWGSIVGDVVHNLASALDNFVFELARINPNPPMAPNAKREAQLRRLQKFPSCKTAADWTSQRSESLFFINPSLVQRFIEPLQPFYESQQTGLNPDHHPLRVIHDLWNRDKHQSINLYVVSGRLDNATAVLPGLFRGDPAIPVQTLSTYSMRPLQGKTLVGLVRVQFPFEIDADRVAEVAPLLNCNFSLGVSFGEGIPAEGQDALATLQRAHNIIAELFYQFA